MRTSIILLAASLLSACGSSDGGADAGLGMNSCGAAGALTGSQCTSLAMCGAGAQNQIINPLCEHCLARPDTHVCEAGTCRPLDSAGSSIMYGIAITSAAVGAASYTVASINPIMADGTKVSCAALMSGQCSYVNNGAFNTGNSTFKAFVPPADPSYAYQGLISADVGADRLLFIEATSALQGKGTVKARGCVEGLNITAGASVPVEITLR